MSEESISSLQNPLVQEIQSKIPQRNYRRVRSVRPIVWRKNVLPKKKASRESVSPRESTTYIPIREATEERKERLHRYRAFIQVIREKGFPLPEESDVQATEAFFGSVTVRLPTIGGTFPASFSQTSDGKVELTIRWIEDGVQKFERAFRL